MKKKKIKKKYEKPELKSIHLLAEEVLTAGCKSSGPGPSGSTCAEVPCSNDGS